MADAYDSFPDHDIQQVDADQAYIQADFEGEDVWFCLPEEAWGDEQHHLFVETLEDGSEVHKYSRPCVRLRKASTETSPAVTIVSMLGVFRTLLGFA